MFGAHQAIAVICSIAVGFAASQPRQWSPTAFLLRGVYVLAMVPALG